MRIHSQGGNFGRRIVVKRGDPYGAWEVIRELEEIDNIRRILCVCRLCGERGIVMLKTLTTGASKRCIRCGSRGRRRRRDGPRKLDGGGGSG